MQHQAERGTGWQGASGGPGGWGSLAAFYRGHEGSHHPAESGIVDLGIVALVNGNPPEDFDFIQESPGKLCVQAIEVAAGGLRLQFNEENSTALGRDTGSAANRPVGTGCRFHRQGIQNAPAVHDASGKSKR